MKTKRYWLRFGTIAAAIVSIVLLIVASVEVLDCHPHWRSMCGAGTPIIAAFLSLGLVLFVATAFEYMPTFPIPLPDFAIGMAQTIFSTALVYFLVGSLVGLAYERLRKKP